MFSRPAVVFCEIALLLFCTTTSADRAYALASNNIPLDSPIYLYLEKLVGFGIVTSNVQGIRPFSKAEAARLTLEAESNLAGINNDDARAFASGILDRLRELIPREVSLRNNQERLRRSITIHFPQQGFVMSTLMESRGATSDQSMTQEEMAYSASVQDCVRTIPTPLQSSSTERKELHY